MEFVHGSLLFQAKTMDPGTGRGGPSSSPARGPASSMAAGGRAPKAGGRAACGVARGRPRAGGGMIGVFLENLPI